MQSFFTSRNLKWLAFALMIADHLAFFLPDIFPVWIRYFGRISAPIFLWLVVVNVNRSSNPKGYLKRLCLTAIAISIGSFFVYFLGIVAFHISGKFILHINIFAPLTIIAFLSYLYNQRGKYHRYWTYAGIVAAIALAYFLDPITEGGAKFLTLGYIFILFNTQKYLLLLSSTIYTAVLMTLSYSTNGNLSTDFQWMWIAALIPLFLTSDVHVRIRKFEKNFFYFLYPINIWALYLLWSYTTTK